MNSDGPRIQPLPPSAVAKLKSSTSITTLKGVILDLVKNALDANARTVYITVDALRGGCIVEDDGDGIPPLEFHPSGGLGKAHHTSRLGPERDVYGHRGSFLASLSALSMLTITSHHFRHTSTNTIVFHHATPVVRLTPAPSYQGLRFSNHGTSITVNDLFGNLPVRVKSRALALQKSEEVERQWDDLRQLLVPLMLANNQLIKLVVMDASGEKKLSLCPKTLSHEAESALDLQRINTILFQAGLVEARNTEHWDVVSASVPGFQIQAAISRIPSTTKKVQFLSLGVIPVLPQSSANIFYTEINRLFALSDFDNAKFPAPLRAKDEVLRSGYETLAKASPKECTRWPMFYIRITSEECNSLDCDAEGAPEAVQYVQRILDVLGAMLNEFLDQQGLRPRARKKRKMSPKKSSRTSGHEAQCSNTAYSTEEPLNRHIKLRDLRRPMTVSHHFGNWTRVKSASIISKDLSATARVPRPNAPLHRNYLPKPAMPSEPAPNDTIIVQSPEKRSHDEAFGETNSPDGHFDPIAAWIDPYTGRSHMINSRTGQSIGTGSSAISLRPRSTGSLWTKRGLEDQDRPKSAAIQPARNAWVENLLDDWKPPVFGRPEKAIDIFDINTSHRTATPSNLFRPDPLGVAKYRGKLRKHDLKKSQIIAQVDRKFILAAIGPSVFNPNKTLVLVDQHAADERCRVEALLASFLPTAPTDTPPSVRLDSAIVTEIPASQTSVFKRYRQFYSHWGVEYSIEQRPRDTKAFVFVHALPALIAERCRAEPELVTQLVRGEIWHREESGGWGLPTGWSRGESRPSTRQDTHHGATTASDSSWFGRLDTCPRGIIDLLNSRACRTAIMFNDVLTVEECQGLVSRLAGCTFPFQCAHGRPSMIPILDIDASAPRGLGSDLAWGQTDEYACNEASNGGGFAEAYQRWRGLG
ncbi:putative DNA mismatch repair protein (Mlh3) [Aspergillus brunneoviolaceus CBS 621.78]|uniref:Uncharacterized protein n=1 Tax=Aspergillus brunneoviolaceus CBS 621.78 TaxID=1450534 RepID=A0ACD1GC82_9EURO|nr:hypothetical protein BO95DRAFT_481298 [Aspergillus brunneoviolaceus CBS 621.78]RAH46795.1 hypothetical protein BO95DRAFT_481298 [Aspergillus brunneoviolaceus CBS 621.78]